MGAAVLVMLIAAIAMGGNSKRKKRPSRAAVGTAPTSWLHGSRGPAMVIAAAAACAFALLGTVAFTRPTERTETAKIPYTESGNFTYGGRADTGPVYPTGRVETGEPIYLQLVRDLQFEFGYTLKTSGNREVTGSGSFTAELSDGNGWSREFVLSPESQFEGGRWSVTGVLHLRDVRELIDQVQAATGVFRDFYTLTVLPHVGIEGTIDRRDFSSEFAPGLSFQVGALEMQVASDATTTSATPSQGDALRPSQGGAVVAPFEVPSSFSLLGISLDVSKARWVGAAGTVLSLALLALLGLMVRAPKKDEPARIDARFGRMIVAVGSVTPDPTSSIVEVTEIESLVALARRYDRAVLHESCEGTHRYVVENDRTIYSYTCAPSVDVMDPALSFEDDHRARDDERAQLEHART